MNELRSILGNCLVCKRKDIKRNSSCNYVEVTKPGDRLGIDILELLHGKKILTAIDYFSRKLFAMEIGSKEGIKVVNFLDRLYKEIPFKSIISDNGKEFCNDKVRMWMENKNVKHEFSIPYYHQSNGRIERANRTLRNACKKTPGLLKVKLKRIVENYNNVLHRGIGMSPNEALKEENHERVKIHENKYKKEFKKNKGTIEEFFEMTRC